MCNCPPREMQWTLTTAQEISRHIMWCTSLVELFHNVTQYLAENYNYEQQHCTMHITTINTAVTSLSNCQKFISDFDPHHLNQKSGTNEQISSSLLQNVNEYSPGGEQTGWIECAVQSIALWLSYSHAHIHSELSNCLMNERNSISTLCSPVYRPQHVHMCVEPWSNFSNISLSSLASRLTEVNTPSP